MPDYADPEVLDPSELAHGDQVGCSDAGPRLRPMVGDNHDEEPVWVTLGSDAWAALAARGLTVEGKPLVLARRALA